MSGSVFVADNEHSLRVRTAPATCHRWPSQWKSCPDNHFQTFRTTGQFKLESTLDQIKTFLLGGTRILSYGGAQVGGQGEAVSQAAHLLQGQWWGCFHTLIVGQLSGVGGSRGGYSSICRNNCGGVSQAFPIPILWQWGLNTWSHWRHSWNSKYWRFLADSSWFVTLDVFKIMCKGSLMIWVFVKQWALCCST